MSTLSSLSTRSLAVEENLADESLIFGESRTMKALQAKLRTVATSDVPVLICGEGGTGKEVLARLIHHLSSANGADTFLKLNRSAFPTSSFEGTLASRLKKINAENHPEEAVANRATLFLDEVTDLDATSQLQLLHFLQDGGFCAIAGEEDARIETRVICATSRNPEAEIGKGKLREDLYYRINVISVRVPPLRERRNDIARLAQHFIDLFNDKFNVQAEPLSADLVKAMRAYDWPGNVRQLENMMKRYVILGSEEAVIQELNSKPQSNEPFSKLPAINLGESISLKRVTKDMVRNFERQIITKTLEIHSWNRTEAARALNISYRSLLSKVKSAQLVSPRVSNGTER